MKEFIDKLISRLDELIEDSYYRCVDGSLSAGNENGAYHNVKDIVNELAEEYINTSTEHINCSTDTSTNSSTKVSEMPTGWIPCSEKQPNKDGYFLVTTSDGEVDVREYDYGNGWGWDGFERIIAWQPLPAPYTEGESR